MGNEFHEEVPVEVRLGRAVEPGAVNRALRTIGFRLYYDVYAMPRHGEGPHPNWQSDKLAEVELLLDETEVDAQDPCNTIRLIYPLATIDSSLIDEFIRVVAQVRDRLRGELWFRGQPSDEAAVSEHLTRCVTELLAEWGEEPGSKGLRIMIMNSYPR